MKRIFPILVLGMLGPWTAAAQSSASVQGGASAQSQTSVQTSKSGAQASGSGLASLRLPLMRGRNSADIFQWDDGRRDLGGVRSMRKRTSPATAWKRAPRKT